ncbi:SBBP repeat-containing protein, partial [Clostridium sp. ATCC 25772]|uniref:SBBP repeat-containing protein n=1 Tax=Clostridium sp. ATCC 25772 TaxID=1676991 RepID=UPI000AE087E2
DQSYGIAVDLYNNVYITGFTTSLDFPTTFNQGINPDGNKALFVTKLDSTGGNILYSVYIHGNGNDWGYAIALDSNDNAYITGNTTSSNYPSTYTVLNGNKNAVFITKIDSTGTNLPYSVYIDGNGDDWGLGIDVNALSEAYITGYTYSSDFPVINKLGPNNLSNASASVYIIKVNDLGTALPYSAYIHGNYFDISYDIALDSSSNA